MGVGCLTVFVALTLGILLIITICGIPFGLLVLLSLVVAWIFGWIALGRMTGEKVLEAIKVREILPIVAVVVGILVLTIVSFVPIDRLAGRTVHRIAGTRRGRSDAVRNSSVSYADARVDRAHAGRI